MCLVHRGVWLGSLRTLLNMWLFWLLLFSMFLWKGDISEKKLNSPRWILYECICYNYTPCVLVQHVARIACNESMSEVIMCVRVLITFPVFVQADSAVVCCAGGFCMHNKTRHPEHCRPAEIDYIVCTVSSCSYAPSFLCMHYFLHTRAPSVRLL